MTPEPVTSPPPDLALVDTVDLLDEIAKRYGRAVLVTERSVRESEGVIGVWSNDGMRDPEIIGLLEMAKHWMLRDPAAVAFSDGED